MKSLDEALAFIVRHVPIADREDLRVALLEALGEGGVAEGFRVLDPDIRGAKAGGKAFLWEDVLSLSDLIDSAEPAIQELQPDQLAKLLVLVLSSWRRMREVRLDLTAEEFMVLRAVKRGARNAQEIAAYTNMDTTDTVQTVKRLEGRLYKAEFPVLERTEDGLTTRF